MKSFKRVLSLLMVVLMIATAIPFMPVSAVKDETETYTKTVEISYTDSSVAENSSVAGMSFFGRYEFDGCYGNQLSGVAREIYDSMAEYYATDGETGAYSYTFETPFTFVAKISGGYIVTNDELEEIELELSCAVQVALDAFLYDHPEVFWLNVIGTSYGISASGNSTVGYTGIIDDITITPIEIYSGASAKKSRFYSAVDSALTEISVTESRYDTLKNIHDYICNNAWYNLVSEQKVHSSEPFFIGDGGVVCEGYAKTFKIICDRLDIPCVLVSGDAGGAHMWNYVQMDDGKWYLVDATWDDQQSKIYDTYFLANANTVGFDGVTISKERTERNDFSGTGIFSFTYPVLSSAAYTVHVHEWESDYTVDTEPTCTTNGSKSQHCTGEACNSQTNSTPIPAINHANKITKPQQDSTCASSGYTAGVYCPDCKEWLSGHEEIPSVPHAYETVTIPATLSQDGKTEYKCSCGDIEKTEAIARIATVKLSTASCTWNGKVRSPSVTVKDSEGNTLKKGTDYDVTTPSGRKSPGQYTYTITFKGNYEGTKKLTFTIVPKAPAVADISATQSTSVIKLTWSESVGATGYRVYQYSPSKGKYVQIASVKGVTSYRKATNLKAGTEYSFKIKPYTKLSDGTVLWGVASEAFTTATECKAPAITSVTSPSKSKATVKWSDVSGETGYQLYYSTSKNGTYKKVKSYGVGVLAGSKTFSSSASGKTIYFKVRAYSKVNGQTVFSQWSTVKSVKLK